MKKKEEKGKKQSRKSGKEENEKSIKAKKLGEISWAWKNGKKSRKSKENERIILTKRHFMLIMKYDV